MIPPKKISVDDHLEWQHSLLTKTDHEEIDSIADHFDLDIQPSQTRSGREINVLLAILDSLGKEGSH